jgi:hypothetical protein
MPERKTSPVCNEAGGLSANGDGHTHVCREDKGHGGRHRCWFCPYTW